MAKQKMAKSFSFEGRERVARDRVSEIGLTDTSHQRQLCNGADEIAYHLSVTNWGNAYVGRLDSAMQQN